MPTMKTGSSESQPSARPNNAAGNASMMRSAAVSAAVIEKSMDRRFRRFASTRHANARA